jgi:two-component system, chemotaxis family, sensor histidine kinase and response regulator WspE
LLALDADPKNPAALEALMRGAHSLKGAARIVGLEVAVRLSHVMEDCFVAAQAGTLTFGPAEIDVFLRAVDVLSQVGKKKQEQLAAFLVDVEPHVASLVTAMNQIHAGVPIARAPSMAPPSAMIEVPTQGIAIPPPRASGDALEVSGPESLAGRGEEWSKESPTRGAAARVVRVGADNMDRVMGLSGEALVEAKRLAALADSLLLLRERQSLVIEAIEKLGQHVGDSTLALEARERAIEARHVLTERIAEVDGFARRSTDVTSRLYREVLASRMRPFAEGVQGFPRAVRDLARQLGKKVKLEISGESTEVDRDVLERIEAPLNHIVRNCVDHGLETPMERVVKGKPERGTLRISARHSAGMLLITVGDDGKGIDLEEVRKRVIERGMVTPEIGGALTDPELLEFIFLPGFSTAKKVTEVSGRGVGLDVVHTVAQELGGYVRAVSELEKGTTFHIQVPITLSVIRAVVVEIAGEPYAFPLMRIDRILRVQPKSIEVLENRQYFQLDGQNVGLLAAQQVLELGGELSIPDDVAVLVLSDRTTRCGLAVDAFLGEHDLVVRRLDPRLGTVQDIGAAAMLEDGTPVLIVDVDDLLRSVDAVLRGGRLRKISRAGRGASRTRKRILVVDDSITVREAERQLLTNRGYDVEVAVDGMEGWNLVRTASYDLVISDVDMPRMNGLELVRSIKGDAKLKNLPVVMVSYKDREEDRVRGLEAGANYYLTKSSFHDETLIHTVVDLIGEAEH